MTICVCDASRSRSLSAAFDKSVVLKDALFAKQAVKSGIEGFGREGKPMKFAEMMALAIAEQMEDLLLAILSLRVWRCEGSLLLTDIAVAAVVGVLFTKVFQ